MNTLAAIVILVILSVLIGLGVIIQERLTAFKTAKLLLESLRGENDQFQNIPVIHRTNLLIVNCANAGMTLKELGISMGELNELCTRRLREEERRAAWNKKQGLA